MNVTVSKNSIRDLAYIVPPVVPGESESDFEDFCREWITEYKPKGPIERDWVHDIILGTWERRRWERYKIALMTSAQRLAVQQITFEYWNSDISPDPRSVELAIEFSRRWSARDATARAKFDSLLTTNDLDRESVMARALTLVIDDLDRCDQLIAACLRRRDAAIAQLERRHSSLATRLRSASEFADDADYELVADGEVK